MWQLVNLERLHVNSNALVELPASIGELRELRELIAWNNRLEALPNTMEQLDKLHTLCVNSINELSYIPEKLVCDRNKKTMEGESE